MKYNIYIQLLQKEMELKKPLDLPHINFFGIIPMTTSNGVNHIQILYTKSSKSMVHIFTFAKILTDSRLE